MAGRSRLNGLGGDMSAPAWMPLYIGDYLADTQHLTTTEHGAYLLLIMHYWEHGGLPKDEKLLRNITKLSVHKFQVVGPIVLKFFDQNLCHARIDKERGNAQNMISKRSAAGKAGAAVRHGNRTAEARAIAGQSHSIVRVSYNHKDSLTSLVGSLSPREEKEGSAEEEKQTAPPAPLAPSSALLASRLLRKAS